MARMVMIKSNVAARALLILVLGLALQISVSDAKAYFVGGRFGWDVLNYSKWSRSTIFRAGDVLVFKYEPEFHEVAVVSQKEYQTCVLSPESPIFATGYTKIVLKKGWNFFMCGRPGHCQAGMKLAVQAI